MTGLFIGNDLRAQAFAGHERCARDDAARRRVGKDRSTLMAAGQACGQ
jgi:hypothetical protein